MKKVTIDGLPGLVASGFYQNRIEGISTPLWVKTTRFQIDWHVSFRQLRTCHRIGSRQLCATSGPMQCNKEKPRSAALGTDRLMLVIDRVVPYSASIRKGKIFIISSLNDLFYAH